MGMTPIQVIRSKFPRLRRNNAVAIVHNGGVQTVVGCLCGDTDSYATKWPVPAHARRFRADHASCATMIAAQIEAGVKRPVLNAGYRGPFISFEA